MVPQKTAKTVPPTASDHPEEFSKETFAAKTAKGNVIVDYWAPWCGPCRMMAPEFEAASKDVPNVKFAKVNTENEPELAGAAKIFGIPTVVFFKDGKEVGRFSGARPKAAIVAEVKKVFG